MKRGTKTECDMKTEDIMKTEDKISLLSEVDGSRRANYPENIFAKSAHLSLFRVNTSRYHFITTRLHH